MQRPSFFRRLRWALGRRCPNCGARGIFPAWFRMERDCPRCGLHFERMPGYWLGAMILNFSFTAMAFFAVFGLALAITWPEPPWMAVWIGSMVVAGATPAIVFPWTRTLFAAMELAVQPPEPEELER